VIGSKSDLGNQLANLNSTAKEWICLLGCISSLAVGFFYRTHNDIAVTFTFSIILFVAALDIKQRSVWPLLALVVILKLVAIPVEISVATLHKDVWYGPFIFYLSSALIDLSLLFCLTAYSSEVLLVRLFRVKTVKRYPHIFLMSALLAFSAFYACAQAIEWLIYFLDRSSGGKLPFMFGLEYPPFYMFQNEVKLTLKIVFDLMLWSLLLTPERWSLLRRLQGRFQD